MALRGGEDEEEEEEAHEPALRCLDAARYAAASVVTVLILIVVAKATKVVLFPESLYISLVHGSILVTSSGGGANGSLYFHLEIRVGNPRRQVPMYFSNVTVFLFDNDTQASTSRPEPDRMIVFNLSDIGVEPETEETYPREVKIPRDQKEAKFFDFLYNNDSASLSGVTMRMDALVGTEVRSWRNKTLRAVAYYCWPLVVQSLGAVDVENDDLPQVQVQADDVFCREVRGSHFI